MTLQPPGRPYPPYPAYGRAPAHPPPPPVRPFHRPHWGTVPLGALYGFLVYFVISLTIGAFDFLSWVVSLFAAAVATCAGALAAWWMIRFRIEGDDLIVDRGLLRRNHRRVPLSHLQAVDILAPLIVRIVGLAELRVELAGGDHTQVSLRYLSRRAAAHLRAELLARSAGLNARTPEAPERPFFRVPFGLLLGSVLLTLPVLGFGLLFIVILALMITLGEPGLLAGAVPVLIALLRGVLTPLFQYGGCRIAMSPDGLRLTYGLMAIRMQTLPPGRIHAVRILEPVIWRAFGWVRVDFTVAGYAGERAQTSQVLLPVAAKRVALDLVNWLFPGAVMDSVPMIPARVAKDSRAAGANDAVFVARYGRICQRTDLIPHARVQAIRLTQGPVERLLGAATVHLDPADGPVRVIARGRDVVEARTIVDSEKARARAARAARGPERWAYTPPVNAR